MEIASVVFTHTISISYTLRTIDLCSVSLKMSQSYVIIRSTSLHDRHTISMKQAEKLNKITEKFIKTFRMQDADLQLRIFQLPKVVFKLHTCNYFVSQQQCN